MQDNWIHMEIGVIKWQEDQKRNQNISKQVIIRCVWPVKRIPVQLFHKDPETGSVPLKDFDRSAPAVCKKQTYSGSMGRGGISA